ncbi:MAG: phosphoribosylformylglycinamidine synthase subunit PurS [Rickettsiales bacterium]|jgi:phosphoribosylformylglycinamidine synthase subunit PurS|nr:phosphoribosylformylglycinamidine synthase subunit PurS [Rickettsiales bacterium]
MKALIYVTLKDGVLDPQGAAITNSLSQKGINNVSEIRQGKYFEVNLDTDNEPDANNLVDKICQDLLVNTVLENYSFKLVA